MPDIAICSHCRAPYLAKPYKARQARHYCSRKCKAAAMMMRVTVLCHGCGKPVTDKPSRVGRYESGRTYCSKKCHGELRSRNPRRVRFGYSRRRLSPVMTAIYGNACVVCSFDRYVELAHIVAAKDGGTIHPSNIVALCPNHHRLMDAGLLTDDEKMRLDGAIASRRLLDASA